MWPSWTRSRARIASASPSGSKTEPWRCCADERRSRVCRGGIVRRGGRRVRPDAAHGPCGARRFLARAGPDFHAAFSPEILFWAHQDYPLLVPGIVAQGFQLVRAQPVWVPAGASYLLAGLTVAVLATAELRGAPWLSLSALTLL